jgi:Polyketide synthase modules and related proteins
MVNPEHTVSFSKLGVLSPAGSSKSFDASADGYARSAFPSIFHTYSFVDSRLELKVSEPF